MNKFLFLAVLLAALGCAREETIPKEVSVQILLLQVDYDTKTFEGAKEFSFAFEAKKMFDSIPAQIIYNGAGDFGDLTLRLAPTKDTLFMGTIMWTGLGGERKIPSELAYPNSLENLVESTPLDSTQIQLFHYPFGLGWKYPNHKSDMWLAINNLKIVTDYLNSGAKVGFFMYRPVEPIMDSKNWKGYFVLFMETEALNAPN